MIGAIIDEEWIGFGQRLLGVRAGFDVFSAILIEVEEIYDAHGRKSDVQTVGRDGTAKKVYEAECHPNRQRHLNREAEYDRLDLNHAEAWC